MICSEVVITEREKQNVVALTLLSLLFSAASKRQRFSLHQPETSCCVDDACPWKLASDSGARLSGSRMLLNITRQLQVFYVECFLSVILS